MYSLSSYLRHSSQLRSPSKPSSSFSWSNLLTDHIRVHAYQLFKGFSSDLIKSDSINNIAVTIKISHTLHASLLVFICQENKCDHNLTTVYHQFVKNTHRISLSVSAVAKGGGIPLRISYNFNQSDFIICVKIWSSPCVLEALHC